EDGVRVGHVTGVQTGALPISFALAAQRTAGFALGIATYLFGWAVINGKVLPRRLGAGAVAGGLIAAGLALAFPESTKADEAAFVLPVLWQVVTGAALLRRP